MLSTLKAESVQTTNHKRSPQCGEKPWLTNKKRLLRLIVISGQGQVEISAITFFPRHTRITLRFYHHLYSSQIPNLGAMLLDMLPNLREHICYNRHGLGFLEELADTELGHAFEHVILAILHQRGLSARGQTTWNWQRDPIGTYHVTINTGKKSLVKESLVLAQAIFTNALLKPVLRFVVSPPEAKRRSGSPASLLIQSPITKEPRRLLFSDDTPFPKSAVRKTADTKLSA